ncbi:MAG: exodeoxyribonuclease V subunit gamma [Pseudonocardia sp.]
MTDSGGGVHVHRGERADALAAALAELLAAPLPDPFAAEVVAVSAPGMERWLAQRLAHRLGTGPSGQDGVCAAVRFPSPAALVGEVVEAATGVGADTDPWRPERLVWPLLTELDAALDEPWCATLAAHLGRRGAGSGNGDGAGDPSRRGRRFGAARRLAGLYAAYAVHRPQLLADWRAGRDGSTPEDLRWQAELWRRVRARVGGPDPAQRWAQACEVLGQCGESVALPSRVSVFGPTRLPAAHLEVLVALARHREVHLWLPHPSPALWRRQGPVPPGTAVRRGEFGTPARHPLLASLGRDLHEMGARIAAVAPDAVAHHHPADPPQPTLLGMLQADLRTDRVAAQPPLLPAGDRSVTVHACHGAHRQVEVLREAVLGLLAADPTLEPRDVLVMCPDVETFAPLISAAFGLGGEGPDTHPAHRLQVRLADRALRQVNPVLGTLAQLLELAGARLTASQLLDLAGSPPVRRRFRLTDEDLDRLRDLTGAAGVRWGLDAAHRAPFGLERFGQNTWSAGLDRLLLGVATGGTEWLGTALPLDVEPSDVDRVGRLAELVERVGAVLTALAGEKPLPAWITALTAALDTLTDTAPADAWQATQARAELAEVAAAAGPAAAGVPLGLPDVRSLLAVRMRGRPTRANFRTGTLTVATLVPMRAVPHRVVCLLGMDDGLFPRAGLPDGDDVLARDPLAGERDVRAEDRQLLLDAVCAATEHLVVLYSGADERTGARRPPAVPLGELLDALDLTARTPDGRPVREHVVVRHPLQPFDARNFTAGALGTDGPFSFDRAELAGARAASGPKRPPAPPVRGPLPATGGTGGPHAVALADLVTFVRHPARSFLRRAVGLRFPDADDGPGDTIPVEPDGLRRWAIGDRLLRDRLAGVDLATCQEAEWRRGELPPGALGRRMLAEVVEDVEVLVGLAEELRGGRAPGAVDVDLAVDLAAAVDPVRDPALDRGMDPALGARVVGTVGGIQDGPATADGPSAGRIARVEFSRLAPKHRLRAWVELLAVTLARPERAWRAVTIGRGTVSSLVRATLGPVPPQRAAEELAMVVALFLGGRREALPLVTGASYAYAFGRTSGAGVPDAAARAEQDWRKDRQGRDDPAHRLVWGAGAPLAALLEAPPGPDDPPVPDERTRFGALAVRLWRPLFTFERVERL